MLSGRRFGQTGAPIQVGGLKASDAKVLSANTAVQFDANLDRIVEIVNYTSSAVWFVISSSSNPTNASAADGNCVIPPNGSTRPFLLKKGMYIEASASVNVRALDVQE